MQAQIFLFLLAVHCISLSSSHYHVLVADDQRFVEDQSLDTLFGHLRNRRSLTNPNDIMSSMTEDEGSGTDDEGSGTDDGFDDAGEIQEFQFFVKNNHISDAARTTISELMPGNAVLTDFSIHNQGKTYKYDKYSTMSVEEAGIDYQNSVSNGLSTVMLGDVKTTLQRCSDCRADESNPDEAVAAVVNVAPGDILSISLSYMVPKSSRIVQNEVEIYRTDTTINLDESAQNFTGVVMSPNYPNNYPNSADLTWLIEAPTLDMVISTNILSFVSEACCDHLYIYDGPTDTHPLIYVLSGDVTHPETIYTTRSSMLIKFQTDTMVNDGGFALEFHPTTRQLPTEEQIDDDKENMSNSSTVVLMDSYGVFMTPNYPEFYSASSTTTWDVMVESGYTIDLRIIDFDIFPGETLDVIDLLSGEVVVTLDETLDTPYDFNVSSSEISIAFHSLEKIIPKRGLYGKYFSRKAEEYSLPLYDTNWHVISSPYYPHDYSSNEHLVWIISVEESSLVRMEVTFLSLENGYDFLIIYSGTSIDDSHRLASLSGSHGVDIEYLSSENSATIVFESDRSITNTGFQLKFRNYITYTNCSAVTDVIEGGPSGAISNVAYPSSDYLTHNCQWLIVVKETKAISVFLDKFSASYAQITFYDGSSKSDPVLWSTSSYIDFDDGVSKISSSNQILALISRTQSYNTVFSFRFQEIDIDLAPICQPDTIYTTAPGQITNPMYPLYAPDGNCQWLIEAPIGFQVLATILYRVSNSDSYNQLYFYNGNSTASPMITNCRYNCYSDYWVKSGSNSMLIVSSVSANTRFKLDYQFVSGSTALINREIGSAMSPSFPSAYPDDTYEITYIEVPSGSILFYFDEFQTEACCDYLNIYDGDSTSSPLIAYLSGDNQGFRSQTTGRYLTLEFSSDGSVADSGFRMDFCSTTQDCGFLGAQNSAYTYLQLTLTDVYYRIGSPSSSGYYPNSVDFYWYIDCPSVPIRGIGYEFERLDVDGSDTIAIYSSFLKDDDNVELTWHSSNCYYTGCSHYSNSRRNLLWFHSDTLFQGLGFDLRVYCDE